MIAFDCPGCGKHYQFSDRFAGRTLVCTTCRADIVVPEAEEELGIAPQVSLDVPSPPLSPFSQPGVAEIAKEEADDFELNILSSSYSVPKPPPFPPMPGIHPSENLSTSNQQSIPSPPKSVIPPSPPPLPSEIAAEPFAANDSDELSFPEPPLGSLPPPKPPALPENMIALPEETFDVPPVFTLPDAYTPQSHEETLLAHVYAEKRNDRIEADQSNGPSPIPVPKKPEIPLSQRPWFKTLRIWGSMFLFLVIVLGTSLYLALFIDWSGPDSRPEIVRQLNQRRDETIIQSKNTQTQIEQRRLQATEFWNKASETADVYAMTLAELEFNRQVQKTAETIYREQSGSLDSKLPAEQRKTITSRIRSAEKRLDELRQQFDSELAKAVDDEKTLDEMQVELELSTRETNFCTEEAANMERRIAEFPKDRTGVYFPHFDKERNRPAFNKTFRFSEDWTEYRFEDLQINGPPEEEYVVTFDGSSRFIGLHSLRVSLFQKQPITILFPKNRQADDSAANAGQMLFSLRFPDLKSPILAGDRSENGRIEEIRVRFGNPSGYIEYKTNSPRYCDALFYDSRGKYSQTGFTLENDPHWTRSDHFDTEQLERPGNSIDDLLSNRDDNDRSETVANVSGSDGIANDANGTFFSRIDWAEIRITPQSDRTTFWIDGIQLVPGEDSVPDYDLDQTESLQVAARREERAWFDRQKQDIRQAAETLNKNFLESQSVKLADLSKLDGNAASGAGLGAVAGDDPEALEFAGTKDERKRKLVNIVLDKAGGGIVVSEGTRRIPFGTKSARPKDFEFLDIVEINLAGYADLDDSLLDLIGEQTNLERLDLARTGLKNEQTIKLGSLTALKDLNLGGNALTFASLHSIKAMKGLEKLNLDGMKPAAEGLDVLGTLTKIKTLILRRSGIDGADLNFLLPLADLETLDIGATRIGDRGIAVVRVFSSLKSLDVSKTRITGPGLSALEALKELKTLKLDGTQIDNKSLEWIGKAKSLTAVSVSDTAITSEGIRQVLGPTWLDRFKFSPMENR